MKNFLRWHQAFFVLALCLAFMASCGGGGGGGTAPPTVDVGTLDGQTGIATNAAFKNTFAEPMDTATVTTDTFFIRETAAAAQVARGFDPLACDASGALPASVSCSSATVCTLTPSANLTAGASYTVCLTTDIRDANGNPYEGSSASFQTEGGSPPTPPSAPANMGVIAGDAQTTISWDAVTGATSYNLYWATAAGVTTSSTKIAEASSPYAHTELTNGTTYYYAATAVGEAGESALSSEVSATPQVPAPGAPTNPGATAGYEAVTVSWDAVAGAASYNIYWAFTSGVTKATGTKIANATSPYVHGSLTPDVATYYVVTAVGVGGESAESAQVSATAKKPLLKMFVTSVTGMGKLGDWADAGGQTGLAAGNAICQARAQAAGLPGIFKAWLSDSTTDAYCNVHNLSGKKSANCGQGTLPASAGPWQRTDGKPFAEGITQMLDSDVVYTPPQIDEFGAILPDSGTFGKDYVTGTQQDGTASSNTCVDWAPPNLFDYSGSVGNSSTTGSFWTAKGGTAWTCNFAGPILCFQTVSGSPLPPFAETGKMAYLLCGLTGNLGGLAGADLLCDANKPSVSTGPFKAWLSDSTHDARDRITSDGPWVRPDGIKVAANKAGLTSGTLLAPMNQDRSGAYVGSNNVWTSTDQYGVKAGSVFCSDWTSTSGQGNAGNALYVSRAWTVNSAPTCTTSACIYCLENRTP